VTPYFILNSGRNWGWVLNYRFLEFWGVLSAQSQGRLFPTAAPGADKRAAYDAANEMVKFNADTLGYDANGNLLSDGEKTYTWDARNRLVGLSGTDVAASFSCDPFGNTTVTGTSTNVFQYTGRENDGTGLYYYRARYYSPKLQRFVSEDPIRFAGGMNFYRYVGNNPIRYFDPWGLIYVKDGVDTGRLNSEIRGTFPIIDEVSRQHRGDDATITSTYDSNTHRPDSKHYTNDAIDIRGRDVSDDVLRRMAEDIDKKLGDDYDVIPEFFKDPNRDHIHIEYDPKNKDRLGCRKKC
jgi:RHS repeat-associated protein